MASKGQTQGTLTVKGQKQRSNEAKDLLYNRLYQIFFVDLKTSPFKSDPFLISAFTLVNTLRNGKNGTEK